MNALFLGRRRLTFIGRKRRVDMAEASPLSVPDSVLKW